MSKDRKMSKIYWDVKAGVYSHKKHYYIASTLNGISCASPGEFSLLDIPREVIARIDKWAFSMDIPFAPQFPPYNPVGKLPLCIAT